MNMWHQRAAAGLALLLALTMTACGSSPKDQAAESSTEAAVETTTEEETADPSLKGLARKGTGSAQASGSAAESAAESTAAESTAESTAALTGSGAETAAVSAADWQPSHKASEFKPEKSAITMRLALADEADSVTGRTCQKFADLLSDYSGGTISAELYPGGELFSRTEIGMAVSGGYVQAAAGTPGIAMSKTLAIFEMANVFSSMDYAHSVCDKTSDFRALISGIMESSGVHMLGLEPREYEVVSSSRAVRSAGEITGLHLALTNPDIAKTYWTQWGADVTESTVDDLYYNMQSGKTEAQVSTVSGIFERGVEPMQQYVINTHSHLLFTALMMNGDYYASLSDNARAIIDAAAEDAMSYSYADALGTIAVDQKRVEDAGMEYIDFTVDDIRALRGSASEADSEVQDILGENTYGRLMAALGY